MALVKSDRAAAQEFTVKRAAQPIGQCFKGYSL
jgi:hypothetical protein